MPVALLSVVILSLVVGIGAILVVAVRRQNVPAIVNAIVVLAAVCFAILFDIWLRVAASPPVPEAAGLILACWIAGVGLLHAYGMMGPYDDHWWWDHVTHTLAAGFIAALTYAAVIVLADHTRIDLGGIGMALMTVGLTLLAGGVWEVIEFTSRDIAERMDIDPVLDVYGRRDTLLDLVFDLVGAVVIVALDVRVFVPLAEHNPGMTVLLLPAIAVLLILLLGAFAVLVTGGWIRRSPAWAGREG